MPQMMGYYLKTMILEEGKRECPEKIAGTSIRQDQGTY